MIDNETYEKLKSWGLDEQNCEYESESFLDDICIQKIIQDAIIEHEWTFEIGCTDHKYYVDIFEILPGFDGDIWNENHESLISEEISDCISNAILLSYMDAIKKKGG